MYKHIVEFIKALYPNQDIIPLHAPVFQGNEKKYVVDCIDSSFVSSVGQYVNQFENMVCSYTGAKYAVATTNGTSALHTALILVGVMQNTEVLTQALTFVATANAISYIGADPIFIDSGKENLGMCPNSLLSFLEANVVINSAGRPVNKISNKVIAACVPMHVFGNPVEMDEIILICKKYKIPVVEDAAESLGSFYKNEHTGLRGDIGIFSFNGNKIVTCGGGGMIITNNEQLATRAKFLTTTAKKPHPWEFYHDEVGFNYRLPNLNAALACAQMESLPVFVENKRQIADVYRKFFFQLGVEYLDESKNAKSNFWLNAIKFENLVQRNDFLKIANDSGVMIRPIWNLMTDLPAFRNCSKTTLPNAKFYVSTVVNIPSSVRTT